jgi:sortase A
MKAKMLLIVSVLLLVSGLGVMLYPTAKTAALHHAEQQAIVEFERYRSSAISTQDNEALGSEQPSTSMVHPQAQEASITERDFSELWEACVAYNQKLVLNQAKTFTAESAKQAPIDLAACGWEQEVFAYLSIPAAKIEAPLYLGASSGNMDRGGAILGQTSLPIGGASSNCVIAGHRTWNGAIQFKGLDRFQPNDMVYITNPWERLAYQVIETKTISPNDSDEVMIQDGRDLLTVFTCTYPNTHRFLVICARVTEGDGKQWNPILLPLVAMP